MQNDLAKQRAKPYSDKKIRRRKTPLGMWLAAVDVGKRNRKIKYAYWKWTITASRVRVQFFSFKRTLLWLLVLVRSRAKLARLESRQPYQKFHSIPITVVIHKEDLLQLERSSCEERLLISVRLQWTMKYTSTWSSPSKAGCCASKSLVEEAWKFRVS
ncbi:hypothetical protein L596_026112 [Steinernema carpocapsae]|uniref:Uncharacterized protein n=1 Tax=Steinernema carpocapsae TaxID=34508 RepID=A0A4U5M0E2_STECR|nr:hypothetical protein L596_026112 [Steinernema carpocapsae]